MTMNARCALVMAGGTGGHIFPGLAVAEELRARGWRVHWLGAPGSMESRIVPAQGFGDGETREDVATRSTGHDKGALHLRPPRIKTLFS